MHHYHCEACGFRVLSDSREEAITVAQQHHGRRHNDDVTRDAVDEHITQVSVADQVENDDDDYDDLGPVFSGGKAKEW